MRLIDLVKQLDAFDDEQTILLDRSVELSAESECVITWMPDDGSTPPDAKGMKCFLDIWHAKEVIEGKARLLSMPNPTESEKVNLLIDYAQTGA